MFGSPSMKRSFLVMRNLEQLPIAEIAAVLGLPDRRGRQGPQLRALQRLRAILEESP
jgi:DNA-directed RNA polymerase specialized sigma24 family protein